MMVAMVARKPGVVTSGKEKTRSSTRPSG